MRPPRARALTAFFALGALACGTAGGAGSSADEPDAAADTSTDGAAPETGAPNAAWVIALDPAGAAAGPVTPALLGQYDLSGALLRYDAIPGLPAAMKGAGMRDWRVGVGRWEVATRMLPTLTDGSACPLAGFPKSVIATETNDLALVATRDWFTDDGAAVTIAATNDDARYSLGYVRSVLDVASAFGARPLVNVDHMPRAFAVNKTFSRTHTATNPTPCTFSWTNKVSNVRPADAYLAASPSAPPIFALAVAGMVKRIVEGSGGAPGRAVLDWEIWNEPDLPYAWDPDFDDGPHSKFFTMAIETLLLLDAYRAASPSAKDLRFGLGSFASADFGAAAITGLEGKKVPVDFFSFHSYSNDPLVIVGDIQKMLAARNASKDFANAELYLTEWGPDLANPPSGAGMDTPLVVATVLALAATAGLDRAYHSIFYEFIPGLQLGLIGNSLTPTPLSRVYELYAKLIGDGGARLAIAGAPDGRFEDGQGAAIAVRDVAGKTRVLVVNRAAAPRTVRIDLAGNSARPSTVTAFDDPAGPTHAIAADTVITLAPRSLALVEL